MRHTVHIPMRPYEAVDFSDWSYVLESDEENVRDAVNRLPLNVPLCSGCDRQIIGGRCDACELVFLLDAKPVGDGFYRVEV